MKKSFIVKSKLGFYSISKGWIKEYPEAIIFPTRNSATLTAKRLALILQEEIVIIENPGYEEKETKITPWSL